MSNPTPSPQKTKRAMHIAREAWIKRYAGYFGEPYRLDEYRRGDLTFREFYMAMIGHAEDMVTEAGRIEYEAFNDDE